MTVVVLLTAVTGVALLWALYAEQVPPRPAPSGRPVWHDIPTAADIRRQDFPVTLAGYDPAAVDAHLQAVAEAFTALRAAANHLTSPSAAPETEPTPTPPAEGDGVDA